MVELQDLAEVLKINNGLIMTLRKQKSQNQELPKNLHRICSTYPTWKVSETFETISKFSPNMTILASEKFLKLQGPSLFSDDKPKKLSTAESFNILQGLHFSKRKYVFLVSIFKSKGVFLISYQTIRVNFLNNLKTELPIEASCKFVKINPSTAICRKFLSICEKSL